MPQPRDASRSAMFMLILDEGTAGPIAALLTAQGHVVHRCESGEEALETLQKGLMPQCILMTPVLPGIDGWRLCRILRAFPACRRIPILILTTACGRTEAFRVSSGLGPGVMLVDRSDPTRLDEQVRRVLDGDIIGELVPVLMIAARGRVTAALRRAFKQHGFSLRSTTTPTGARRILEETRPAVVLYDTDAPAARDGIAFDHLGHLAAGTPWIVLSGSPSYAAEFLRQGAWMVVTKPVNPGRLVALCEQALSEQAMLVAEEGQNPREQRLVESEERYRVLFENAIEGIFRSSLDGRLLLANPSLARMFGYASPQEAVEYTTDIGAQIYADPEERARVIQRLLKEEEIRGYEVNFKRTDGTTVWVALNFYLRRDASGHPLYIEGTCVDITQRKRAEEELRRREEKFFTVFQSSPTLMAISNIADGRYIEVNERFVQAMGYARAEAIGKTSVELGILDAETRNRMRAMVAEQGAVRDMEMRILTRQGEIREGLMSAEVIDLEGQPYLLTMFQDITARKRIEQELRESEERLQAMASASFEAITFSENGICFDVNEVATQMSGYSRAELIGMKLIDLTAPESRDEVKRRLSLKSEEPYAAYCLRKDGSHYPTELRGRMFTYRGREVRATAIRDVSARVRAERALKQSEEKYRTLVENARVVVLQWDPSGKVTFVNEFGLTLFGYTEDELVGRNVMGAIVPETESSGRDLAAMIAEILQDPERFRDNENENITKDGRRIWMHWSNKAILNEAGAHIGILSIGSDITARKRAEQDLQTWMQRYELIVEVSGQVAYDYIVPTGQIAWGASLERVLGLTPEEMNGGFEQWRELLHPDDRDETLRTLEAAEHACAFWEARYRMRHKDGGYRWIRDRGFFLPGPDGRAHRQLGMMEDITAAQKAEAELNFRATLLATLQESSIEGILVVDAHGRILSFNRRFIEIWGLSDDVLESRNDERTLQAALGKLADPEGFQTRVRAYYAHPEEAGRDEILLADGRTLDRYTSPVRGSDGTYYGRVWYFRDVTEEKRAEEALRQSEDKYRAIFENAVEGMFQSSPEGRYVSVNPAFARMFGFTSPEEMMASISDIGHMLYVHPEERERLGKMLAEQGHVENFEVEVYHRNGTPFWISVNSRTERDQDGVVLYYEGSTFEITERRAAEERLREINKRLEDIIEFLPDATFIMDQDKRIIAWNRAIEEMTGVPKAEMLGKDRYYGAVPFYGFPRPFLMDLIDKDDAEIAALYEHIVRKGGVLQAEVFAPALYGNRGAFVFVAASPLLDSEGRTVGAIESVRDINEAKLAEMALRQSEEQLRLIIDHMNEGLALQRIVYDAEGRATDYEYLMMNPACERITGVPAQFFLGRKAREVFPPGQDTYLDVFLGVVETGDPVTFELYSAFLDKHIQISAYRPGPGQFTTIYEDITERKRAEEELKQSEEKFAKAFNASPEAISIATTDDATYMEINEAFLQKTGYGREEVIGRTADDLGLWVNVEDRQRYLDMFTTAGRVRNLEIPFRMHGGEIRHTLLSAELIHLRGRRCSINYATDITERKRAEEALRASEELYRLLTENAYDMISRHAPDGTVLYVSPACRRMLGYDPEEMIGRPDKSIVHPDDLPGVWDIMNRRFQEGADTYTLQHRTTRKDGGWLWVETAGRFIRNADGSLREIQCGVRDISERVRALEALRASEEKFRSIIESSPVGMHLYRLEDDGRLILIGANPAADRMLGVKHADLLGRTISEAFPALAGTEIPDLYFRVARGESGPQTFEFSYQDERFSGSYAVIVFPVGQGSITAEFTDITERKRAEEALRTSESFLSSIIDQSPNPMWISDDKGTLIRLNQALLDLLHLSEDEVLGRYNIFQDNIVEEQGFMPLVRRVYNEGEAVRFELRWDSSRLKDLSLKESVFVILDVTIFPIRDAGGRIANAVIQHRDITARRQAQAALEELDRELKRKNQELESIVYATSHDLRSPLLNIQGFGMRLEAACADLLEILKAPVVPAELRTAAGPILDETIPKALKFIRSSVEKMDSLIKGLLQLSRLGRAELIMLPLDVKVLLEQVIAAMGFQIQQAGAAIELGDLPACRGDASQLSQVFSNLIDNALKYRAPERELLIRVYGQCEGDQCVYCVEDNGVGIPESHREKIWELFHRLDPGGAVSGEGLGLTVVRRILDRHKGKVWVEETETGMGSRFCFTLKREGAYVR